MMKNASRRGSGLNLEVIWKVFGIAFFVYIDGISENPYIIASFGATAILIYGAPKAPFSRPKNVFFGHLFSALIGVTLAIIADMLGIAGDGQWLFAGLAVATAIVTMMLTGTIHPPGGATALTCVLSGFTSYVYVVRPVMLGIVVMLAIAWCANHLRDRFTKLD
ncbi:MAG: HPP family protein [archaeon]|nr:HPP family protein [archaeon]